MTDKMREPSELRDAVTIARAGSEQATNPDEAVTVAPREVAAATLDKTGRSFGDYELLEEIARGGMGVVYKARQRSANRIVALKMILAGQLASSADVQRFRMEAVAAANLDHPHIVLIFEVGEHDGQHFFSMKFINGESLAQAATRNRGAAAGKDVQRQAAALLATVARAVHHAHQRGILHRDLKPGNILLDAEGQPHITDFGLAKKVSGDEGLTHSGVIVGTPSYMAPEQARSEKTLTTAADVYSLGAILYERLTSVPPVRAGTHLDTILQVLEREPDRPRSLNPAVDPDLETICLKCLQKESVKRYGSAEALAEDLERWLTDEPITARPVGNPERLWRWCRRNRAVTALVVLPAITGAGALVSVTALWLEANRQRDLAQKEGGAAIVARDQAEKNLELAHQNFALAQKAVEDTTTKIAADPRLRQEDLHRLRRDLLASAVPYYEAFVMQQNDDPKLRAQRGRAYWRLASIQHEIGENSQAAANYEQMRGIFEKLAAHYPDDFVYRDHLIASNDNLGAVLSDLGKSKEAEAAFRTAIELGNRLIADFPDEAKVQREMVGRYSNLGTLLRSVGRLDDAEAELRKGLGIQEQLAAGRPLTSELSEPLAASYHSLGALLESAHKVKQAEDAFRASLKIRSQLAVDFPKSNSCLERLATSYNSLAIVLSHAGSRKDAEAAYREALQIREKLAADFSSVPEYRRELAASQNSLGILLLESRRFAEVEAAFRAATAGREKLCADFPQVPRYAADLGGSYCNMGQLLYARQQPQAALEWYDKAIRTLCAILAEGEQQSQARKYLCNSHRDRAYALDKLRRYTEAFKDWDRALDLADDETDRSRIRLLRAGCWAHAGETAKAAAEADELAAGPHLTDIGLYDAACIHALAAAKAQPDTAETHAAKAVDLLRRAQAAGYFRRSGRVSHLTKDADLDSLRNRPDFRTFLAELDKAAPGTNLQGK